MTRLRLSALALLLLAGCSRLGEPAPVDFRSGDGSGAGYTVAARPGDTIESIAQRFNLPSQELADANHLQPPYGLRPGQVLVIPPPAAHTVRDGDTVAGIANFYGVDEVALARANGLEKPYHMRVGQVLAIPGGIGGRGNAAIANVGPMNGSPMVEAPPTPKFSISAAPLPPPSGVAVGPGVVAPEPPPPPPMPPAEDKSHSSIVAPAVGALAGAGAGVVSSLPTPPLPSSAPTALAPQMAAPVVTAPPVVIAPSTPVPVAAAPVVVAPAVPPPAPAPAPVAAAPQSAAPQVAAPPAAQAVAAAGVPHFLTPVKGQVISNYGADAGGQKNDGINIAAAAGTPVQAADAGTVVYAGNELAGFGNLVLIRHAGGWVTAYGHMASIDVQRGAAVTRGQAIGAVGQTGSVTSPQLHFEVRQGSKPVDPAPYLGGKG